jgi:RNA polymerase-binding transcription factor
MTPMELANLQRVLEAMRTELEDLLRNRAVRAVDPSADMLDQIQRASEDDMEMGNLERESARLREVRAALQRIGLGTFGICLECDEEISLKRLVAVPWTSSCIVCRQAVDSSRIPPRNTIKEGLANAA